MTNAGTHVCETHTAKWGSWDQELHRAVCSCGYLSMWTRLKVGADIAGKAHEQAFNAERVRR